MYRIKLRGKIFIWFLALAYLVGQMGCVTGRYEYPKPEPLPEEYRAQLGTIGVTEGPPVMQLFWQTPTEGWTAGLGEGAAKGVKNTAGKGLAIGIPLVFLSGIPGLIIIVLGLALAPPAALIGGAYGAIVAESSEAIKNAETQLQKVWATQNPPVSVQTVLVNTAQEKTNRKLVSVPCAEPQKISQSNDCEDLKSKGIDTLVEPNLTLMGLAGSTGINPSLHLSIGLSVQVIRTADKVVLGKEFFEYSGSEYTFVEWADHDGRLLKEEFSLGYKNLADQVIAYLFLTPPPLPPGDQKGIEESSW